MTRRAALLATPAAVLLAVFLLGPYVGMVTMSLREPGHGQPYASGFTLENYTRALSGPVYQAALGRSLLLGFVVTSLCVVLAYPVALHLARAGRRSHVVFYAIVVSPLLLGVLVRNFGWLIILAPTGPVSRIGIALGFDRSAAVVAVHARRGGACTDPRLSAIHGAADRRRVARVAGASGRGVSLTWRPDAGARSGR